MSLFSRFRRSADADTTPAPLETTTPEPQPAAASIEPGWYPTADGEHMRWHDGEGWTRQVYAISDSRIATSVAA